MLEQAKRWQPISRSFVDVPRAPKVCERRPECFRSCRTRSDYWETAIGPISTSFAEKPYWKSCSPGCRTKNRDRHLPLSRTTVRLRNFPRGEVIIINKRNRQRPMLLLISVTTALTLTTWSGSIASSASGGACAVRWQHVIALQNAGSVAINDGRYKDAVAPLKEAMTAANGCPKAYTTDADAFMLDLLTKQLLFAALLGV